MSKADKGPALIIGIGKPKKSMHDEEDEHDDEPMDDETSEGDDEDKGEGDELDMHLDAAWEAIQSGDKAAFKEAMRKCQMAEAAGDYEE